MRRYFIILFFPSLVSATLLVPSLGGNKGLYRLKSADLGYPGVFHFRLGLRIYTSDLSVHYPYIERDTLDIPVDTLIDTIPNQAVDTYSGGDFDFSLGLAVTEWLEVNVQGRYRGDAIDCDLRPRSGYERTQDPWGGWYYMGWENRSSVDRGDTDVGVKLCLGKFLRTPLDIALHPYVTIPTGQERIDSLYPASFFRKRTKSNRGGIFRYFTTGRLAPGILLILSGSTKTVSPISGYLNFGYQFKGKASEFKYGLGVDVLFFDYFDPFIEFWGKRRALLGDDPFGDHPPSYISLGMKWIGTGLSADICVDFLVLGKRKYEFKDFFPKNPEEAREAHVTTGWGTRPTWAINLSMAYSYDFYNMRPITNKAMIMGRVVDKITKEGIDAVITPTGAKRLISDPFTGAYEVKVSPGKVRLVVSKKGYHSETKLVTLTRGEQVVVDFELEPEIHHGVVAGKVIDKWSTKPIEGVEILLLRGKEESKVIREAEPGSITKTVGGKTYKLNPETGAWELVAESIGEDEITTIIDGKLHRLNLVTGKWEEVKGATMPLKKDEITTVIDGKLHRLNLVTGRWEEVKEPVRFEDIVKEEDITQTIGGELYKLNLTTGVWEKVVVPTTKVEVLADTLVSTEKKGLYRLDLVPPGTHLIRAEKEGYITQVSPVVCEANKTSILNFELFAQKIILRGVHFEFDKANLLVDSYPILEKVYKFLKENPDIKVEIGGHTDWIASEEYNLDLSYRRANAVRNYLIMHGIDPDRLIAKGYGESMPIADNNTEEGRALNRRIELKILKK